MIDTAALKKFLHERLAAHARRAGLPLADDTQLLQHGLVDSMEWLLLIGEMERAFGFELDFSEAAPEVLQTIGGLVDFCRRAGKAR